MAQTGTLVIKGRDVPGGRHNVRFDFQTLQWSLSDYRVSPEREHIIEALRSAETHLGYSDLAAKTGKSENTMKRLCIKVIAEGKIQRHSPGRYFLNPHSTDNTSSGNNASDGDNDGDDGDDSKVLALPSLSALSALRG